MWRNLVRYHSTLRATWSFGDYLTWNWKLFEEKPLWGTGSARVDARKRNCREKPRTLLSEEEEEMIFELLVAGAIAFATLRRCVYIVEFYLFSFSLAYLFPKILTLFIFSIELQFTICILLLLTNSLITTL